MKKLILLSVIVLLSLGNVTAQDIKFSLDLKTDLWGVSKGSTWLIKPKYTHIEDHDDYYIKGFARVGIGSEYSEDILWGLVDKYGNEIVEPKYYEIGSFYQNRALINKNDYYGYIDPQGNEVIKPKYAHAKPFDSKGQAIVAYAEYPNEQDYHKIDINDNLVIENNIKAYTHKNGLTSAKGKEVNGKKQGEWKFYNEEGYLVEISNYNNEGVAEGNYKRLFWFKYGHGTNTVNRNLSQTGNLKNGKKDGLIVFYNPNNGKPTYTELWENGVFKKVKDIYDSNGNLVSSTGTGKVNTYREDSKYLSSIIEYLNGHRAGEATWYHPNKTTSQVRQKALYKYDANDVYGLRWEIIEINDYSAKPLPKGTLKNGNGTWVSYDDYDKPTMITTYQNGKKAKEEIVLAKDIDKIYENINSNNIKNNKEDSNIIDKGTAAERAISNEPYEAICVRAELTSQNYGRAFQCAKNGDEKGIVYCTGVLGLLYHDGLGTQKDLAKAFQYYKKAAELGLPEAMYYLGLMYHDGEHVQKNGSSAFVWFEKSAEKKIPEANYVMSRAYYFGYPEAGIDVNYKTALDYAINAKETYKDNPEFINHLAYCYFSSGNKKMAYGILQNLVKSHPDYANGFDSLGEVGLSLGFKEQATANYKKAAQMGVKNAIEWCKQNSVTY